MPRSNAERPVNVPMPALRLMLSAALDGKRVPKYIEAYLECLSVAKPAYKLRGMERDVVYGMLYKAGAHDDEIDGIYVCQISAKEIARKVAKGNESNALAFLHRCEKKCLLVRAFQGCKGHSNVYLLAPLPLSMHSLAVTSHEEKATAKDNGLTVTDYAQDATAKDNGLTVNFSGLTVISSGLTVTDYEGEATPSNNLLINTQESSSPSASAPAIEGAERPLCMKCHRVMRYVETPYHDYRCFYCQELRSYQVKTYQESSAGNEQRTSF